MQRIGMIGSVGAMMKVDFFADHWDGASLTSGKGLRPTSGNNFGDVRFTAEGVLPDLANSILNYLRGGGRSPKQVERPIAQVNDAFEKDLREDLNSVRGSFNFPPRDGKAVGREKDRQDPQTVLDQALREVTSTNLASLRVAVDRMNREIADVVDNYVGTLARVAPAMRGPFLAVRDNRVVFLPLKSAPGVVLLPLKSAKSQGVGEVSGGSNNAIMFSLVGAGLGYALAPKNRGMAAGVGAVAGYIGSTLLK